MIDRIIAFSIGHRWCVVACTVMLALGGLFAMATTPVDAIPDLSENQVIVFTDWMGHGPREIDEQITSPLSQALDGLRGVRVVRGSSDFNFSMIHVIFDDGLPHNECRRLVGERLADVRSLPTAVSPVLAPDAPATGQIFWYIVDGRQRDPGQLRLLQDWHIRPQLQSVQGVAEVASVGGAAPELVVELDPLRMAALDVPLEETLEAVRKTGGSESGYFVDSGTAEYSVAGVSQLGTDSAAQFRADRAIDDLELATVTTRSGQTCRLSDIASITYGPGPRRGVLEIDGNEAVGGVVTMSYGQNPLEVTGRLLQKIAELEPELPSGCRIVPMYDRSPLITGALRTVATALIEAMLVASLCVLLILMHVRAGLLIASILPLAVALSFLLIAALRWLKIAEIETNMMSLAGITISIGVLVDAAIVMVENAMVHLRARHGSTRVRGDTRKTVEAACQVVARPIFFSILIMLVSFLPVFSLSGMAQKMFWPLACTKSFALASAGVLAITIVPALCTILIRGRIRDESASRLVRGVQDVYRPILLYLLDHPAALAWWLIATLLLGIAPLGNTWLLVAVASIGVAIVPLLSRRAVCGFLAAAGLVLVGLTLDRTVQPLATDFLTPLDEQIVMDMPITAPGASVTQASDDLKARDMLLCRFPEVAMVMGKAGRAESALDPAPMDMIETMVAFRPQQFWPKRTIRQSDAQWHIRKTVETAIERGFVEAADATAEFTHDLTQIVLDRYSAQIREFAYQRLHTFERELARNLVRFTSERMLALLRQNGSLRSDPELVATQTAVIAASLDDLTHRFVGQPTRADLIALVRATIALVKRNGWLEPDVDPEASPGGLAAIAAVVTWRPNSLVDRLTRDVQRHHERCWRESIRELNSELFDRATAVFARLGVEETLFRMSIKDPSIASALRSIETARDAARTNRAGASHHGQTIGEVLPSIDPHPQFDGFVTDMTALLRSQILLWPIERNDLVGFGGELDRAVQMPGWTNVWTMPIQNRVDMLATGVSTPVGVRVLGRDLDEVVGVSQDIAGVLKDVPGAADVVADPIRGRGYLNVALDPSKAGMRGAAAPEIQQHVAMATGGAVVSRMDAGREPLPVRVRFTRDWRTDADALRELPIAFNRGRWAHAAVGSGASYYSASATAPAAYLPLDELAAIQFVDGPATIKSENGQLRNYVRLKVRDRDTVDFVREAQEVVANKVSIPDGIAIEWVGQFQNELATRRAMQWIVPSVVALIFMLLAWTYHDLADATMVLLAVPGALAGGVFLQWLLGFPMTITVWIGYIACFGMVTATGVIMLVYLRQAIASAGGLEQLSLDGLRQAVLDGAVHRLRPKLLTEGTTILGIAPMLWASGIGAEIIRPMAAPVLGGLLVADEVIDLFLPVLFYWERRRRWRKLHERPPLDEIGPLERNAS